MRGGIGGGERNGVNAMIKKNKAKDVAKKAMEDTGKGFKHDVREWEKVDKLQEGHRKKKEGAVGGKAKGESGSHALRGADNPPNNEKAEWLIL